MNSCTSTAGQRRYATNCPPFASKRSVRHKEDHPPAPSSTGRCAGSSSRARGCGRTSPDVLGLSPVACVCELIEARRAEPVAAVLRLARRHLLDRASHDRTIRGTPVEATISIPVPATAPADYPGLPKARVREAVPPGQLFRAWRAVANFAGLNFREVSAPCSSSALQRPTAS